MRWTVANIHSIVEDKFCKCPCWLQIQIALALYAGNDVIACAAIGTGKTLSFWIPLLMALEDGLDKMSIVVTPLNLLGKQNVMDLEKASLAAIAVSCENVNANTFKVSSLGVKLSFLVRVLILHQLPRAIVQKQHFLGIGIGTCFVLNERPGYVSKLLTSITCKWKH